MKRWLILLLALAACSCYVIFGRNSEPTPPPLKVSILGVDGAYGVNVRFENITEKPVHIFRPLDGSEWGWHMPVYGMLVSDSSGKQIPLRGRCGLSGLRSELKWPDDYRIEIPPGGVHDTNVLHCREIPQEGDYSITFTYQFDLRDKTPRKHVDVEYPKDLWVGKVSSAPVTLRLVKNS